MHTALGAAQQLGLEKDKHYGYTQCVISKHMLSSGLISKHCTSQLDYGLTEHQPC